MGFFRRFGVMGLTCTCLEVPRKGVERSKLFLSRFLVTPESSFLSFCPWPAVSDPLPVLPFLAAIESCSNVGTQGGGGVHSICSAAAELLSSMVVACHNAVLVQVDRLEAAGLRSLGDYNAGQGIRTEL